MSATPILDLEDSPPEPPSVKRKLIAVLLGGVLGTSLVLLPGFNGILFIPALYVAIAVHEVGHLVVGSLVGMPPGALVIGGIVIFKSGQRWIIRFDLERLFAGGLAKALPQKDDLRLASFGWMIAGGPIASLVLMLACAFVKFKYGDGKWGWTGTLFWIALLITAVSLIPVSSGLNKSDGARLWTVIRRPDQCRSWMALWALQTEETQGVLPRDWDTELVRQMLAVEASAREYPYVQLLAFYRCTDENKESVALDHLENALARSARVSRVLRQCIFLEAAASSALSRGNVAQARTWIARAGKVHEPISTDDAEAAVAVREKRYDDALRHLESAHARIERLKLDSGLARFAKEQIATRKSLCKNVISDKNVLAPG
jgi:Peptidase family M50